MRQIFWATFVIFLFGVVGCGSNEAPARKEPKFATLAPGTEVTLILLRQISAGSTREGTIVPFMVAEDVTDGAGNVAIERGTIAEGEVTWSRSEGALSGLMNQPARLAVKIRRTRGPGGETIELAADKAKAEEPFQFTRENTGLPDARISSTAMVELSNTETAKKIESAIDEFFQSGDSKSLHLEGEARDWLKKLSADNSMRSLDESLEKGGSDLEKLVKHVQDGSLTKLAGSEMVLAVTAIQELGKLAHSIENGLSSKLKGRTIKAYVGTPVKAYVAVGRKVSAGE